MSQPDTGMPACIGPREEEGIIFHLASKALWEVRPNTFSYPLLASKNACVLRTLGYVVQVAGDTYTPPTYDQDGFVHATKDPTMLLGNDGPEACQFIRTCRQ